jgi:hypothetical protein
MGTHTRVQAPFRLLRHNNPPPCLVLRDQQVSVSKYHQLSGAEILSGTCQLPAQSQCVRSVLNQGLHSPLLRPTGCIVRQVALPRISGRNHLQGPWRMASDAFTGGWVFLRGRVARRIVNVNLEGMCMIGAFVCGRQTWLVQIFRAYNSALHNVPSFVGKKSG